MCVRVHTHTHTQCNKKKRQATKMQRKSVCAAHDKPCACDILIPLTRPSTSASSLQPSTRHLSLIHVPHEVCLNGGFLVLSWIYEHCEMRLLYLSIRCTQRCLIGRQQCRSPGEGKTYRTNTARSLEQETTSDPSAIVSTSLGRTWSKSIESRYSNVLWEW